MKISNNEKKINMINSYSLFALGLFNCVSDW